MPTRLEPSASRDSPVKLSHSQVKKVGVIGGGASGAIVLDSLVQEGHVDEIVLFERRPTFGGVWVFDDKTTLDPVPKVKVGATRAEIDPPLANPFREYETSFKNSGGDAKLVKSGSSDERQTGHNSGLGSGAENQENDISRPESGPSNNSSKPAVYGVSSLLQEPAASSNSRSPANFDNPSNSEVHRDPGSESQADSSQAHTGSQILDKLENLQVSDKPQNSDSHKAKIKEPAEQISDGSLHSKDSKKVPSPVRLLPSDQQRFEHTPAYEQMKTNIIEKMMTFSDEKHWGPVPGDQFADRALVQQYISRYIDRHANNEKVRIETRTTIEDVTRIPRESVEKDQESSEEGSELNKEAGFNKEAEVLPYRFRVTARQRLADGTDLWYQEDFDSLVVATGHYYIPYIPEVPGSAAVQDRFPSVFEHAKFFTNGEKYKDKTVVVVGSRASGTDLTRFTSDHANAVYQSIRTQLNVRGVLQRDNVHIKPVIEKYILTSSGFDVVFADGSVVSNPDHVIYATGYQFSYPFLEREFGDLTSGGGAIVPGVYQHTFLVGEPLLSIVGIPTDAISFRAFEFQAILVSRFLAGKVALPSLDEQQVWLRNRYKVHGEKRSYHTIGAEDARPYMLELTSLGAFEKNARLSGREFPVTTEAEVEEYVREGLARRDLWNLAL